MENTIPEETNHFGYNNLSYSNTNPNPNNNTNTNTNTNKFKLTSIKNYNPALSSSFPLLKIILAGDSEVGKSTIISTFIVYTL